MIKKTLIVALVLLLVHAFVFPMIQSADTAAQNQWQANVIKAQNYIYQEGDSIQNVIVGSSLAFRLPQEKLPGFYNLAFGGLSIYDGLTILCRTEKLPRRVLVEMNVPLRDESTNFTSALFSPILYESRKVFPSLRDANQPAGLLRKGIVQIKKTKAAVDGGASLAPAMFERMLAREIENYSVAPSQETLRTRFELLKRRVDELKARGVQVVFFEMPVHAKICNLPKAKTIREAFYNHFPASNYSYIPLPDCNKYHTTDGAHLLPNEASDYADYLRSHLALIH